MVEQAITITEQASGVPLMPENGQLRVAAERPYVIDGDQKAIDRIESQLPASCVTRVGSALLLRFGNVVGLFDLPHVGRVEVVSGKWTHQDFQQMLEDIVEVAANLPFSASDSGELPYDRSLVRQEEVLYHAFVYLRHVILGETSRHPVLPALRAIVSDPHRRLVRGERRVPLAVAGYVDPASALRATRGRLQKSPAAHSSALSRALRGHQPLDVDESISYSTFDVPENRFVRAFLDLAVGIVEQVRAHASASKSGAFAARVHSECDRISARLHPIIRHGLWISVGRMQRFPADSTVLQRRSSYRDVLNCFLRLRASSRLPLSSASMHDMLEIEDIASLYESWCFIKVTEAVTHVLGQDPVRAEISQATPWEASVPRGASVTWQDGTEVLYNLSFSRSKSGDRRSYSLPLRPDVVVRIPGGANEGLHAFDAKFRVKLDVGDGGHDGPSDYRSSDLHKMHTYRDAIPALRTAWVMYPGRSFRFYDESRGKLRSLQGLTDRVSGVGVLPAVPARELEHLRDVVRALVGSDGA